MPSSTTAVEEPTPLPPKSGFQSFENAAADAVLAISYNSTGTRYAISSADHKVRIYNTSSTADNPTPQPQLIDQWRAHDAEILDVQWLPSTLGQFFATTGGDNKFKLWREDPSQLPSSGRRFRCIFSQSPPNHVAYSSFEFLARGHDVFLAMFTHDGLLSLLEPSEPDSLASWREIDQLYPFGKHQRGTEPRFCLSFHQGQGPSSQALVAGLDASALSIVVSAASFVKVYRAIRATSEAEEGNYQLQEMLEMEIETSGINAIAWAPGCLMSYDVIAIACEDSSVRIIEVLVPATKAGILTTKKSPQMMGREKERRASSAAAKGPVQSGIGAGLAGMTRGSGVARTEGGIELKHEWKESEVLRHGHGAPVWKVVWVYDGSAVASTSDDGIVYLWKRGIDGKFIEFSQTGC